MRNPFTYGGVVSGSSFCDRRQELRDLTRAMENGGALFVYAERRMGKTSLLRRALGQLDPKEFAGAYVDLWPTDDEATFAQATARALAQTLASSADRLLEQARRFFAHLAPAVTLDDQGRPQVTFGAGRAPSQTDLQEVLEAPGKMAARAGRRMVVVLDEFQQILQYPGDRAERILRSAVQGQPEVAFIFSGSRKHLLQGMFLDESRPLYRSGGHYPLGPIPEDEWVSFIGQRFRRDGRQIEPELTRSVCRLTEGHPFYTQHLCHALWELSTAARPADEAVLEAAVATLLDRESHAYAVLWDSLTANQQRLLNGLALETKSPAVYSTGFVSRCGLGSPSNVQRAVRALLERDVIDRDEGSYTITDRFLRLWIQRLRSPGAPG